ncbi:MAG: ABC transporter substrate-binding protein [Betaproteobacteria bacterium]
MIHARPTVGLVVAALAAAGLCAAPAHSADPAKVLRIAVTDIDTLDPQQYSDNPSFQVIQALFEPAYEFDYLARTPTLTPLTAEGPPDITDGGRTWTIRFKHGILFHDDPAFHGKPRELTADDYVYAYKRWLDPNGRRAGQPVLTDLILGARPVVDAAKKTGRFDFDAPIAGLRALDRYTLRIAMSDVNFPNVRDLLGFVGALPREVVDAAGGDVRAHPVGTGPYRLKEWKRGSRIVLEANPRYRAAAFPASDDPADAALVASMKGKRVPFAGTVELSFVDEDLTRLLLFEQGRIDLVQLRGEIATRLLGHGTLRPAVAARGITRHVHAEPFLFSLYFNLDDPLVGGTARERIALRRAIALGYDVDALIGVVLAGQAIPAGQMIPPGVGGHDPALPARSAYDPATANALLDRSGYGKRDAEGYRLAPDGGRLTLTLSLRTGGTSREIQTLFRKNMGALALRTAFEQAAFQELVKNLERGQFQLYAGGWGGSPSGYNVHAQLHARQPQRVNISRFASADYDLAAERFLRAQTDTGQLDAARAMNEVRRAFMPQLPLYFRLESDYVQPWVAGFRPQVFSSYWKYLDIDPAKRR